MERRCFITLGIVFVLYERPVATRKVPTFDKMMWPLLQALKEEGGSATIQELLDNVVELMEIPEEVQNIPHGDSSRTEFGYRLAWARTYLGKVEAIENSARGV